MSAFRAGLARLYQSAVLWSWVLSAFQIAGGFLLLPLLLRVLPQPDLGMYYVFLSLYALLPVVDFGFSVSVTRYVSYAMGGARELQAMGLAASQQGGAPNFALLWQLLFTTRKLFASLSLIALVLVGVIGTLAVGLRVQETSNPSLTWLAWAVTLVSLVLEIYAGWWNHFLRGMNQVLLSTRIAALSYGIKLILAAALLLSGGGLLAFPAAGFVSALLQRALARRSCLHRLQGRPDPAAPPASLLRTLWPNSWRLGLQYLSSYLARSANALLCYQVLGLAANAQYGLSLQAGQICAGMAAVWLSVKWPLVGQYRSQHDLPKIRALLWPRLWLQTATFLALAAGAFFLGPTLLQWLGTNKQLMPLNWFGLVLLTSFLDLQFTSWTTLLSLENRISWLWPTVASNIASLLLVLGLLHFTSLGFGALVLAPLTIFSLFSYWYWPIAGARSLQTNLWRYIFFRQPV